MRFTKQDLEKAIKEAEVFESSKETGLTDEQVFSRKKAGLVNKSKKATTKSYGKIIFDNLANPLNCLLIGIFVIMVTAKLPLSRFFFTAILVLNSGIGLVQDIRAKQLISKLSIVSAPKCRVVRNGKEEDVSLDDLVLGDVIKLTNGDQIPSDSVIIDGKCSVNESLLTGESRPVNKTPDDELLSGSFITTGTVYARVIRVGSANYCESLSEKARKFKRPTSEIKKSVNKIIIFCGINVLVFGAFAFIYYGLTTNLFGDPDVYSSFASALAGSLVSMIPSGTYLLTSLTLAIGVILLAQRKMLVQELYCIEMLARVDTVCLDKTGTLTCGDMEVKEIIPTAKLSEEEVKNLIKAVIYSTNDSNQTALALKNALPNDADFKAKKYIPFDSVNKFSAVEFDKGGCAAIGAYGFVNVKTNKVADQLVEEKSKEGYRIICVYKNSKGFKNDRLPLLSEIVGVVLIANAVKPDAPTNIKWFQDNNVDIRIISGDNPLTVSYVAKQCGVEGFDRYCNCEDLSNEELIEKTKICKVFGRVSPEQKELIIQTLKRNGHTVAMTGDGVNDILALKVADCSIAMANGSSAARNVAHIVSLENDFSKLPDVVEQGRRVINNLQRSCCLFLSKTLFAIVLTFIFDILTITSGASYPFSTSNMMAWEMISIGFASFFLALQPAKERLKGSFIKNIITKAIPAGVAEIASVLLSFLMLIIFPNLLPGNTAPAVLLSVITFTITSYVVLFKICWPFDKYRTLVFVGCALAGIIIFTIDIIAPAADLLNIDWTGINFQSICACVAVLGITGLVYYGLEWLVSKFTKGEVK